MGVINVWVRIAATAPSRKGHETPAFIGESAALALR